MDTYAIIFTSNRVLLRSTSDPDYKVGPDETLVQWKDPPKEIESGYWKLDVDDSTLIPATDEEAKEAGINQEAIQEEKEIAVADLTAAVEVILNDLLVPQSIKDYFTAYQKLL